jgi:hypothetical protein
MNLFNWVHSLSIKPQFSYGELVMPDGSVISGQHRWNNYTNELEFLLWKTGEHNHKVNYWHRMGYGWSNHFVSFKRGGNYGL